jgi:putative redox protein
MLWKEIVAEWKCDDAFIGTNPAGAEIQIGTIDGKPGIGPMEMLLFGLAGCTGMDITSILRKQRQPLEAFKVRVRALRAETYPMVYTDIQLEYLLWGEGLSPKAVEQAIELSEEKYCSVGIMLNKAVERFTSAYKIMAHGEEAPASLM